MTRTLTRFRLLTLAIAFALIASITISQSELAFATSGAHPQSETPGSNSAVLYTTLGARAAAEIAYVAEVLKQHEYDPRYFGVAKPANNPKLDHFNTGASTLKTILGGVHGVVYIASHGAEDMLLVEVTGYSEDDCNDTIEDYVDDNKFKTGELTCASFADEGEGDWGIWFTDKAIDSYFSDSDTIVHVAACKSFSLADNFDTAREYFGYNKCINVNDGQVLHDTKLLWGRMHGKIDDGRNRSAGEAYKAGGFTANPQFQHQHRAGALDTVLSPAVKSHDPRINEVLAVGQSHMGEIVFDTKMDTTKNPMEVLTVNGCDAQISFANWQSEFVLEFALTINKPGSAELTIHHEKARSKKRFWTFDLDGNQNPAGKNHVGPNRDDYVWNVLCGLPLLEEFFFSGIIEIDPSKMDLVDEDSYYINYDLQTIQTVDPGDLQITPIDNPSDDTVVNDDLIIDTGLLNKGDLLDSGPIQLQPITPVLGSDDVQVDPTTEVTLDTTPLDKSSLIGPITLLP